MFGKETSLFQNMSKYVLILPKKFLAQKIYIFTHGVLVTLIALLICLLKLISCWYISPCPSHSEALFELAGGEGLQENIKGATFAASTKIWIFQGKNQSVIIRVNVATLAREVGVAVGCCQVFSKLYSVQVLCWKIKWAGIDLGSWKTYWCNTWTPL